MCYTAFPEQKVIHIALCITFCSGLAWPATQAAREGSVKT